MLHTVHSTKFLNVPKIYRNFKRFRPVFVDDRISRRRLEEKRDDTIAQDLLFNDSSPSTKSRTTFDLVRALILLRLCKIDRLVDNGEKVGIDFVTLARHQLVVKLLCFRVYCTWIFVNITPTVYARVSAISRRGEK